MDIHLLWREMDIQVIEIKLIPVNKDIHNLVGTIDLSDYGVTFRFSWVIPTPEEDTGGRRMIQHRVDWVTLGSAKDPLKFVHEILMRMSYELAESNLPKETR